MRERRHPGRPLQQWQELDDIIKMYDPTMVIDAMPDSTMSKYYFEHYRKAAISYFQETRPIRR